MNNFIIGMCVYNEEHRFLEKCLKNMCSITDKLIIIDDGSTDNSYDICSKYALNLIKTNHLYNENESKLRNLLWQECTKVANNNDYIFINDADEMFTQNSILHFQEEFEKAIKYDADAIGFYRYDMWDKIYYRKENMWNSDTPWVRCAKFKKNFIYYWTGLKIHGGSIPINSFTNYYTAKLQIQHWAYSTPELRAEKIKFYNQYDPNNKYGLPGQYDSILDKNPTLIKFKDFYEDINE